MAPKKRKSSKKMEEQQSNSGAGVNESSYERERRERIEANKVRLAELGVQRLVREISEDQQQEKKKVRFEGSSPSMEPRRSARLGGEKKLKNVMLEEEQSDDDEDNEEMLVTRRQLGFGDEDEEEEEEEFVPGGEVNESDSDESLDPEELSENEVDTKATEEKKVANTFGLSEDELILQQALALSLENTSAGTSASKQPKQRKNPAAKGSFSASTAEIDGLYRTIVAGRSGLSLKVLESHAEAHNFPWSTQELQEMIIFFDNDKDGMLSLDEFRSMSVRCQILQPEETH